MIRILTIVIIFAATRPAISIADDNSLTPMQRLAALTTDVQNPPAPVSLRPKAPQYACTTQYQRCTSNAECCDNMTCQGAPGQAICR